MHTNTLPLPLPPSVEHAPSLWRRLYQKLESPPSDGLLRFHLQSLLAELPQQPAVESTLAEHQVRALAATRYLVDMLDWRELGDPLVRSVLHTATRRMRLVLVAESDPRAQEIHDRPFRREIRDFMTATDRYLRDQV